VTRGYWGLPAAILLGVVVRVPFWIESLRTPVDGDTAIVGLMARHLGSGTTLWGQPYGSPLDAWVAAPFVAAMGSTTEALRLPVFLLGLALIPIAYGVARALHPDAALPAAVLMACPPPYFLLMAVMPPPFYATTLVLCGLMLVLGLRAGASLATGGEPRSGLALLGLAGGVALWTHLMSASVVAAVGLHLVGRSARRRRLLLWALVPLLAASSPWWVRAVTESSATSIVRVAGRQQTMVQHLSEVVPRLPETVGGILGTHVPMVADSEDYIVPAPAWAAVGLVVIYGALLLLAARASGTRGGPGLLLAAAGLALLAFPFPIRSAPHNLRFLTPLYLPVLGLVVWTFAAEGKVRRAWLAVLALAALHLAGGARLLEAWRSADRAQAPFLLPDLLPVRRLLDAHGIRRVYASYGPAYRLTYESAERIVASQPWNERFRHYALPYLDEVRFSKNVAWVLTPSVPTDLPSPASFESTLGEIGGSWRRREAGAGVVYLDFVPPFGPRVESLAGAGAAGDLDPATGLVLDSSKAASFTLPTPRRLDAVTLTATLEGPRLLHSMDVEVSGDGASWERVAQRRRREEQDDLRWVNGHPQFVLDHDLIAIPLGGRLVAAIRIVPVASGDAWSLGEVLLHPAADARPVGPWDEWLDPDLRWPARWSALQADRRTDREDWYWRVLLASRHR
jgi:4-amino-4-deoxy-L-arabinose transferase-like glycosyltransferase